MMAQTGSLRGKPGGLPVPLAVGEKPQSNLILGLGPLSQGRLT